MFRLLARRPLLSLSLPTVFAGSAGVSTSSYSGADGSAPSSQMAKTWPTHAYTARHAAWPYTESDFRRMDSQPDTDFYSTPRFVAHIDENAIAVLGQYYDQVLPRKGKILELCSSWISHLPPSLAEAAKVTDATEDAAKTEKLNVTGYGMNSEELNRNPILAKRVLRDLNVDPELSADDRDGSFDAATCVVSIDYLTRPREVLASVLQSLRAGASVHLVISNRCFPTKVVTRWLNVSEEERLQMVGDYLWFAGYRNIELVTVEDGKGSGWFQSKDPLWVVRGQKPA